MASCTRPFLPCLVLFLATTLVVEGLPSRMAPSCATGRTVCRRTLVNCVGFLAKKDNDDDDKDWRDEIDWDWKKVAEDVFSEDKRPVVLFDGVCNLCNSGVNFAMDQDESAKLRFCSLQSRVAQSLLLREGKSPNLSQISFITENKGYFSSNAVSHICMHLDSVPLQWFGKLGQFTPPWIRESTYQFVSKNRHVLGESDQCRLDFDGTYTQRFVSDPMDQGYVDYTI